MKAGAHGLSGKRIEFPGLQATITDVLIRVEMLDGRNWTTIVRPSHPWVDISAAKTSWQIAGSYILLGIDTFFSASIICCLCSRCLFS